MLHVRVTVQIAEGLDKRSRSLGKDVSSHVRELIERDLSSAGVANAVDRPVNEPGSEPADPANDVSERRAA